MAYSFPKIRSKGVFLPLIMIVMPLILCAAYYVFFAADRYLSSSKVVVRHSGSEQSSPSAGLAFLITGTNPASREETLYFGEYVHSMDMLNVLEKKIAWSEHYSKQASDAIFWLDANAPDEDKLKFYNRVVESAYDDATGLLEIKVQSYSPQFSKAVLNLILEEGEAFVNELSHKMGRDQMAFARTELITARSAYEAQRNRLVDFQARNSMLDVGDAAASRVQIVGSLEVQLASERASLSALSSSLAPDAPQVRERRLKIQALERQLKAEKAKLVQEQGGSTLNIVAAEFRNLNLEVGISEEIYKASINAVEAARIEASKKIRSLMVIVSPNLPQDSVYPRKLYNLMTIFIFLLLAYGIVRFILATVEDHRD